MRGNWSNFAEENQLLVVTLLLVVTFMDKVVAKILLLLSAGIIYCADARGADTGSGTTEKAFDYMPKIHGTLRTRYEMATQDVMSRFQVRTARVSVSGNVAPFIDYYLQTDLNDRGAYSFLDAWGRVAVTNNIKVSLGQMRIPFSVDASRSPHQYYFANRSTVGKLVGQQRGVGGKIAVALPGSGITAEAGVFNTHSISQHKVWERTMDASCKARYTFGNMFVEAGFESVMPDSVRINQIDGAIHWGAGRWMVEGEYLYKHYTRDRFTPTHAWNVMADYRMPIRTNTFNYLSLQARYDGITANSQGTRDDDGLLYATQPRHQRATVGATLSYVHPKVSADLRLNYENYFYPSDAEVPVDDKSKVVVELVIRF